MILLALALGFAVGLDFGLLTGLSFGILLDTLSLRMQKWILRKLEK